MVLPDKRAVRMARTALLLLAASLLLAAKAPANAQIDALHSAPVPGGPRQPDRAFPRRQSLCGNSFDRLPISAGMAQTRLEDLRALMPPASSPKDFQESLGELCEWLNDIADAHWRLYQSFVKAEATKPQAESEKRLCLQFGGLKRQAMLLKAEFLIKQNRYPEALQPLVDIVAAEPKSATGHRAYQLLQDIGFSEPAVVADQKTAPPH